MGPLQRNLSPEEGASLIRYGYERGINFLDTAELYENYPHIRQAMKHIERDRYVIASKCYAYSKETAEASLDKALREMELDYVDIFMLHEQMSALTIKGHYEAIEYFLKMKEIGKIRAFGISTHYIDGVRGALKYPEIEVVHPIVNIKGLGIQDGSIDEMNSALADFKAKGGGVFGMKPFGGGNLLGSVEPCFDYVLNHKSLDSIAFGMQSFDEIDYNVLRVNGEAIPGALAEKVNGHSKALQIADWCIGCGACVEKCDHKALKITDGKVEVDRSRCVLCGYCSTVCPEFCIKVY